jgi:hypothetical protein
MAAKANPNWGRWIAATLNHLFDAQFQSSGYDYWFEGELQNQNTGIKKGELELRIDGPGTTTNLQGNFYLLDEIQINIYAKVFNTNDLYEERRVAGLLEEWLSQDHCIYRYGDGSEDDASILGVLVFKTRDKLDGVKTHFFGKEDTQNFETLSVEANYKMNLSVGD